MTEPCPGEHFVEGRIAVHNLDLVNLHLARQTLAAIPSDLSSLSDETLLALRGHALRVQAADRQSHIDCRITAEMARRGMASTGLRCSDISTRS